MLAVISLVTLFAFSVWLPLSALLWFKVYEEVEKSRKEHEKKRRG